MVAVQIRDVPDGVRATLRAEAERRGESLQQYLLDVLSRAAAGVDNRRRVAEWVGDPLVEPHAPLDAADLVRRGREERDAELAARVQL